MSSIKISISVLVALMVSVVLSGCQTIVDYQSIKNNVRMATTYESDKRVKVIGKRIEMKSAGSSDWYEAEKTPSGAYAYTAAGSAARAADQAPAVGGC